ncbi:ribosome biogenesis protein SLX9-domain-containing protein [Rhizoctonia solani]|nr:ribosome biogenesis protein SLX9-domain-containing protein [Rhizoctonia solani]
MPKDRRNKLTQRHQPSAKTVSRIFAVPGSRRKRLIRKTSLDYGDADELLRTTAAQPTTTSKVPVNTPTKKEKQQAKHERLLQRLSVGTSPYSKSHNRRLKRKQKTTLSTDLQSVQNVLNTIAEDILPAVGESKYNPESHHTIRPKQAPGIIGEGKGVTLTKQQRKRALELEQLRQSAIMTNSDYRKNPFDAIRRHAQNSLLSHENSGKP